MKIATWNVNSVRMRERLVADWLGRVQPDLLLLQEIKCEAAQFPAAAFEAAGYTAEVVGQKSYNGVAVLSRIPVRVVHRALPGLPDDDAQARYIEVEADGTALVLCHYAFRTWRGMGRGAINLHGHSHGRLRPMPRQFDVGVDVHDFRPVRLTALLEKRR